MKKPEHLLWKLLGSSGFVALVLLLRQLDIPCLFRHWTGWICPGCGLTRAVVSALRLELGAALRYHPMFWSIPILLIYLFFDGRLFSNRRIDRLILLGIAFGFLLSYLIRLTRFLNGQLII